MRSLSNREKIMVVVLGVAAVIAYRALTGEGIGFGGPAAENREARTFGEPPVVRMDLLAQGRDDFDPKGRNLFNYYTPPPAKPKYKPPPPPPPPRQVKRAIPPPPPPPKKPAPQAPAPNFSYLGFLGPKDEKIAVFDGAEGVFLARAGEVLDKEFRLVEFKHDSVMMSYTDKKWDGRTTELKLKGLR
jgi:hypothetical protein